MTDVKPGEAADRAEQLYEAGCNCAEAAWLALNPDLEEPWRAFGHKLAGSFAGGLGAGSVCGAVAGAAMSLGRRYGRNPGEPPAEELRRLTKLLHARVTERFGSVDCAAIKPKTGEGRVCGQLVAEVVRIAVELLAAAPAADSKE